MRIGLSGTGRIGRLFLRKMFTKCDFDIKVVVINSTMKLSSLAHLLIYDSIHGVWNADITTTEDALFINGHRIEVVCEREPDKIPWKRYGVSLVIDATGKFNDRSGALRHLAAGAERVIVTAPGRDLDLTVVMGVNEHQYEPLDHYLLSAASCTTNCLAPILHIMDCAFGVNKGWMTTVHAFTNDQNHMDNSHKDLRRARSCTQSIIPTTSGVTKSLSDVLPHLANRLAGQAIRVPTSDVSLLDLQLDLETSVISEGEVRTAILSAVSGSIGKYVSYNELPLVSTDYIGNDKSAVVDGLSLITRGNSVKLLAWYDNEWAYASRVYDLTEYVCRKVMEFREVTNNRYGRSI